MSKNLTVSFVKKFQEKFIQERNALLSQQGIEASITDGGDEIDAIQDRLLNEMSERLNRRETEHLQKINDALRRISQGTFGLCEECEEPIGAKRLEAIPYCNSCISCAEAAERESKNYRSNIR